MRRFGVVADDVAPINRDIVRPPVAITQIFDPNPNPNFSSRLAAAFFASPRASSGTGRFWVSLHILDRLGEKNLWCEKSP